MVGRSVAFTLLFTALACGAAIAQAAAPEMLLRGRCHQGGCSFTKIVSTQTIGKNDSGYMLLVKERSAIATRSNKDTAAENVKVPEYFGLVKVVYAFCSTRKPAMVFYFDRRFYAHVLNVGEPASSATIDSHIEYWAVCHKKIVSVSDVTSDALAKQARELGYQKVPEANQPQYEFRSRRKAFRFFGL